jgi:DivIVA domain-containing protein
MPSTELDLPLLVTPEQIRRREFVQTRRGYDATQVRDYLEQIARQVEQMQALLREARLEADAATKAATAAPRSDPYEQLATRLADVLRAADRHAEQMKAEAHAEAETILGEARADADRIRLDAQSKAEEARDQAERALREAREHADETISGLASRRAALVDQLAAMQDRLLSVARELDDALDEPVDLTDPAFSQDGPGADRVTFETTAMPMPPGVGPLFTAYTDDDAPPEDLTTDPAGDVIHLGAQELWAGEEVELQIPEIPPLDLEWDANDE